MADAIWFYARAGQQQGPTDLQTLREMIAYGQLLPSELVWRNGMPDWLPAGQVPELTDVFTPAAAEGQPGAAGGFAPAASPPPPTAAPSAGYPMPQAPQALPYGHPPGNYGEYNPAGRSYAGEAQTAMIISIIGIFCVGIILGPIGIVLGNSARRNMRASGNMEGEGMAMAAIVIGWCIVGLAAAGFLLFAFLFVVGSLA